MVSELSQETQAVLLDQIQTAAQESKKLLKLSSQTKNRALEMIERELLECASYILEANQKDLDAPENADLSSALKDRLSLDIRRLTSMAQGIRKVISTPDPVSKVESGWNHANGMQIQKVAVPIGVIGIIYEARPNVTTDAISLCLKSSNACVLRGSKQAWHTNMAIMTVVQRALEAAGIPAGAFQFLQDRSRESANLMLKAKDYIDLIIPRGGETLKNFVNNTSLIPVLGAGGGNCHIFVDSDADFDMAIDIITNAKTQRNGVCNACESLLIDESIKDELLPHLFEALIKNNVEIRAEKELQSKYPFIIEANDEDWGTEYLDNIISIKLVKDLAEAIEHINKYSSGHSEAIITDNIHAANEFTKYIDSACVYVNVSTRFTDGEEFGFGAEIGNSTSKLYVRGPIGAADLCTYKYIIQGNGQIRN